jgi:hypothetical protein
MATSLFKHGLNFVMLALCALGCGAGGAELSEVDEDAAGEAIRLSAETTLRCGQTIRIQERRKAKFETVVRLNLGKFKIARLRALSIGARTGDKSALWYDLEHLAPGTTYTPRDVSKAKDFFSQILFSSGPELFPAACGDEPDCVIKKGRTIRDFNNTGSVGADVVNAILLAYDGRPGGSDYALLNMECLDKAPPER